MPLGKDSLHATKQKDAGDKFYVVGSAVKEINRRCDGNGPRDWSRETSGRRRLNNKKELVLGKSGREGLIKRELQVQRP